MLNFHVGFRGDPGNPTSKVCSGTGDWVVAQAQHDEANWIASSFFAPPMGGHVRVI